MIPALIAVGVLGLFVGVYLGMAGMALLTANRHALMRQVISRQAHELLDVRADARQWHTRAVLADLRREGVRP